MKLLNKQKYSFFILGIILLIPFFSFTQNYNIPLNQPFSFELNRDIIAGESIVHQSFKPILQTEVKTLTPAFQEKSEYKNRSFVARKLFYEHFVSLDTGLVRLTIDPLFNFELGEELDDDPRDINLYKNTRGFNIKLQLGDKVFVESSFRENQANLPLYLSERTTFSGVAYGQGRTKTFKDGGVDFAMASAYVSYSPSDRVNIQVGHGKHFVGNGHRSLLLSDVAFNYPFLKINTNWLNNKIQYQNLYTIFQDLERLQSTNSSEGLFERKQGAFHYLEYMPNNKWSFALFEGAIFPSLDTGGNISVGANYWIPVIFLNTLIEGSENKVNDLVGMNVSVAIGSKFQLYQQLAIANREFGEPAFQIGGKWYIHNNLMLQGEFNSTAGLSKNILYTHYSESLNHPLLVEASEIVGVAQFKKDRWMSRGVANYILTDDFDVQYIDLRQSYIINPNFNFTVHAGVQVRNVSFSEEVVPQVVRNSPYSTSSSTFVYLGVSTNLQNLYFNY